MPRPWDRRELGALQELRDGVTSVSERNRVMQAGTKPTGMRQSALSFGGQRKQPAFLLSVIESD